MPKKKGRGTKGKTAARRHLPTHLYNHKIRILAHDPGVANYGYAVLDVCLPKSKLKTGAFTYKVVECGQFTHPLYTLSMFPKDATNAFLEEQAELLERIGHLDLFLIERFTPRAQASSIERVNLMIGMLLHLVPYINGTETPIYTLQASQWKVQAKKTFDLERAYKVCPCPAHELDAACIALYGASLYYDCLPYGFMKTKADRDALINRVVAKTNSGLTNRKVKSAGVQY